VVLYQLSYTRSFERNNNVQPRAPRNLLIASEYSKSLNPNRTFAASYDQTLMKKLFLLCMCSLGLYGSLFPQAPTETPIASPTATAVTGTTAATSIAASASTPTAAPSATSNSVSSDLADKIHRKLEKKLGHKHGIVIDGDDKDEDPDLQQMRNLVAIPIVAIVFLSIFGAPVAIVVMIGIFSIIATRMRQRTIRMMVEKGQPVPAELLAPATRGIRRRSDARRGVVWTMVGLGLMIWLAAVNDWEGGAWSFGLIPFLIGLGYLIVWKLENKKDIPPPPPAP
jgi:Domain of unknown function (DUF6249)